MYRFNKHRITGFLLVVLVVMMLPSCAYATVLTFTVPAGRQTIRPISLSVDDHVVIKVSVVGNEGDNTLDFSLNYPNGTVKMAFFQSGSVDYPFVCEVDGQYTLNFSNVAYAHDKLVSLDYEIDHYILGMPQMFFLAIIIAVLCVAAVAVFILMGRQH
jgi:hypothetical protein